MFYFDSAKKTAKANGIDDFRQKGEGLTGLKQVRQNQHFKQQR